MHPRQLQGAALGLLLAAGPSLAQAPAGAAKSLLNPELSAHALVWAGVAFPFTDEEPAVELPGLDDGHGHGADAGFSSGLGIRELEIALSASVDPVFRADVFLAFHGGELAPEVEELVLRTLGLRSVAFSVGKLKLGAGRHNSLHQHAWPFLQAPLVNRALYGAEGLAEYALQFEVLLPTPWYSEWTLAAMNGDNDQLFAGGARPFDLAGFARWRNLWDLGAAGTLDLGLHGLVGRNEAESTSWATGAELTVKIRDPRRQRERGVEWSTELHLGRFQHPEEEMEGTLGLTTGVRGQLTRALWLGARYGQLWDELAEPLPVGFHVDGLVAFAFSHSSVLQLQYTHSSERGERQHAIQLQLNASIGPHPAHAY